MHETVYQETTVGEVFNLGRNLYDALMEARPYVAHEQRFHYEAGTEARVHHAPELLDRIDSALAEAGEWFGTVTT